MHDVVIIGGGHNGLVCSAYLAMAGLKVLVLDQRPVAGGAAVTEEFSPGFRNSVASYAVSLLNPKIIRDLDLAAHGLRIVERPISNFLPLDDGRFLKVGGGHTKREVAKFSARDADRLDDYQTRLAAVADVLRASVLETPPNVVEGSPFAAIAELFKAGRIGNRIRALGLDLQRDLLDLFTASAGDFLDGWFESAPIKAAFGFDGVVGNYASPYTPGSAYVLLHHVLRRGERQERRLGPCDRRHGRDHPGHGESRRRAWRGDQAFDAACAEVIVENGRAVGVVTDKGETIAPRPSSRNLNPKLLYLAPCRSARLARAISAAHGELALRLGHVSHERRAFRTAGLHRLARARRPSTTPPASSSRRRSPIWSGPISTRARTAGRASRSSNCSSPRRSTTRSRRRASMSRACSASMSRRNLPDGRSWDEHRETVADLMIDTVDGLRAQLQARRCSARQILSPLDLERTFGLDRRRHLPRRA